MKNIKSKTRQFVIVLSLLLSFVIGNVLVKAKETNFVSGLDKCSNKDLIAKCVYEFSANSFTYTYTVRINDGSVMTEQFKYKDGTLNRTPEYYNSNLTLDIDFTKNENYGCPSYIYIYNPNSNNKKEYNPAGENYIFLNGRFKDWDSKTSTSEFGKIKLNQDDSCLTKQTKTENTNVTDDRYNTCYYSFSSPIYLQIDKKKKKLYLGYDKGYWDGYSFNDITYDNLSSYDNCPAYLCNIGQSKVVMGNSGKEGNTCQAASLAYETGYSCPIINVRKYRLDKATNQYNDSQSSNSKKKSSAQIINTLNQEIKSYCAVALKNDDWPGTNNCVADCINYMTDQGLTGDDRECYMSDEIIAFIYNVLKWVKYIVPVLVIILGILDFVKALAAQDDDAMKKAQGKFVKRLIAAVLLFLLPLIIDYVLSVFNLVDDTCSINTIF